MYRLAVLGAFLTIVVAGCGGGGSGGGDSKSAPAAVADAPGSAKTAVKPAARAKRPSSEAEPAEDRKSPSERSREEAAEKEPTAKDFDTKEKAATALEKAESSKRNRLIRAAAQAAVLQFGLKLADVAIRDKGRSITVLVTRASACRAAAKDEAHMVVLIQQGAPVVKHVRFEVAGTGKQFGYYVLGCKRPKMPNGPGKVVFEHTGVSGPYTSPRFKIKGEKWALEWENAGNSMACIVLAVGGKSKREYFKPVGSRKRETGRFVYRGSGTFQLKIHGAALWSVRVKELG